MDMRKLIVLTGTAILAACGGSSSDEQTVSFDNWQETEVVYSYPFDGQAEVSPNAPVVVRFSDPVEVDASNFTLTGPDGPVTLTVQSADQGRSAVLMPEQALAVKSEYALTLNNIRTDSGDAALPDGSVDFTTRAALEGKPRALRQLSDTFEVASVSPDGDDLPFLDFSSVNLVMTQPLDRQTLVYGDTVTLTQNGQTVPAQLRVDGRQISIDPENVLEPGSEVTLELTNGIQNQYGDAFAGFTRTFSPRDTKPRETLVQEAAPADPVLGCLDNGVQTSPITGDPINCVPLIAKLLGDNTVSKQQGNVFAELGFAPNFPDKTPLRVPKGSLLKGDPLDVRIGGEVPAGFDSGEVTVTFLGDANGYLLPNPYSDDPSAPKQLRLTMDVAFDTEVQRANGAFNQTLLQVELVGYAIGDTSKGSLIVDAVGVVEPEVLGTETAYGVLSFHMESYPDQQNAPEREVDMSSPELAAWQPGEHANKQRPGDPIILNFSEPLDPTTVIEGDTLRVTGDGVPVDFEYYLDGVSIVIQPQPPLQYNTDYQVQFTNGITDIAGNPAQGETLSFSLPTYIGSDAQAPLVLTAYPGFPCIPTGFNLANNDAGRCQGGKSDDDHLPLARQPANRPIIVTFSQAMDPDSINPSTFQVQRVSQAGSPTGDVAGEINVSGRSLKFIPDQPWQEGTLYRYVLNSVTNSPACGSNAICDTRGLPLQTKLLAQNPDDAPAATEGGPDLPIFFRGVAATNDVLQQLRNLPTSDVNANFLHESAETVPSVTDSARKNSARIVRDPASNPENDGTAGSGAVTDANVGCDVGQTCPDAKYSYLSGDLNVEVIGFKTPQEVAQYADQATIPQTVKDNGGVLVYILPTRIVVSNATVFADPAIGSAPPSPTGPQLMRIRYTCDAADGNCAAPDYGRVKGWIVEGQDGPRFLTELDLYLDAPKLAPEVVIIGITSELTHNLHSYPLNLQLAGDVTFLDDGRLQIEQISQNKLELGVELGGVPLGLPAGIYVAIPAGDTFLNYLSTPIKP